MENNARQATGKLSMIITVKKTASILFILLCMMSLLSSMAAGLITHGKNSEDILEMQLRLRELGYFFGEADGYFGDDTLIAVENFQTANDLPVTGLVDPETVDRMKSETAISKKEYIDSVRALEKMEYVFSIGDKGKQVKRLQTLLFEKGYLNAAVTDEYTTDVQTAVCLFQLINNLPVTGIADGDVLSLILSPVAMDLNEYDKKIAITYGDTGAQVKHLQIKLKELGYFDGECTAKFGKNTQDAVYEFQKWNGLEQNGDCGIDMRIMLEMNTAISYSEAIALDAVSELYEGDIAEAVEKVKIQLTDLGFYTGLIDTEFTHELSEAVYFFQLANGIRTTGSADKSTRLLLNSGECITMAEFTKEMSEVTVQRDDAGHQVVLLQRRLLDLGYYLESAHGMFDKKTEEAVQLFQKAHGIAETGIADTDTRVLMNSDDVMTYAEFVWLEEVKMAQAARAETVQMLVDKAMQTLGKPYEAGRVGEDKYGNGGLTYAIYLLAGVELHPTIALQYESAEAKDNWNTEKTAVSIGDQVFFYSGETMLTGICVGTDTVVFASPDDNRVILAEKFMETEKYVFIGSVALV